MRATQAKKIQNYNDAGGDARKPQKMRARPLASITPSHDKFAHYLTDVLRVGAAELRSKLEALPDGICDCNAYEKMLNSFRVLRNELASAAQISPPKEQTELGKSLMKIGPVQREHLRRLFATIESCAPKNLNERRTYFRAVLLRFEHNDKTELK